MSEIDVCQVHIILLQANFHDLLMPGSIAEVSDAPEEG